jgi:lipopolysaccharide export system ATP-binding protein
MILRTENLIKKYGSRLVNNNVSYQVGQGEIVGLLGPNGAGKTTSFYMATGLVKPNSGHVFIDDKEITDLPMYKRARLGIGYLAQEASIFRSLTVEENIIAVLQMTNLSKAEQKAKCEELIEEFSLKTKEWCFREENVDGRKSPAVWRLTLSLSYWMNLSQGLTRSPWRIFRRLWQS